MTTRSGPAASINVSASIPVYARSETWLARRTSRSQLANLLGLAATEGWRTVDRLSVPPVSDLSIETLAENALSQRLDLASVRAEVEALEREGHVAVEAHDGIEGLQLLQEVEPDLVLLGLVMPRLDGFGVLAAMQDLPSVSRTPVVMVAGAGDLAAALRCVEMGATDFVPHPADPVLLRARVNAALDSDRSPS